MLTEPDDLDRDAFAAALAGWSIDADRLSYLPAGFGGHHWTGAARFVTVDDLSAGFQAGPDEDAAFAALQRAYGTAAELRAAGLEFVVAPLPDAAGELLRRVGRRYSLSVYPLVAGRGFEFGEWESAERRGAMATLLGRLHGERSEQPRSDDLSIPSRRVLEAALADLDGSWSTGPYAEPARLALATAADDLRSRLAAYDELAARVAADRSGWVVTHGEPHRANTIEDAAGALHLVDWDTTLVAPRERDLRMILDDELTGWDEYAAVVGPVELDRDALQLYGDGWALADIATFVALLRRPHRDTEDTAKTWRVLARYLGAG